MKEFIDKHINKLLGSAGFLGLFEFAGQIRDYLSDGKLDTHEIEQLFLSSASGIQTGIIIIIVVYVRFFQNDKVDKDKQ